MLVGLALVGCRSPAVPAAPADTGACDESPSTPDIPTLTAALEAEGFAVQLGHAAFVQDLIEQCCDAGFCLGNNPSSPYGLWWLPPGPGQTAADPYPDDEGRSSIWHLGANEALVWVGSTPPAAGYSGWTTYLVNRGSNVIFGSMGDPVNQLVVHTDGPPAGGTAALLATGDSAVEALARAALAAAGVPDAAINLDPLPPRYAHLGLDDGADTFAMIHRVAVFDDPVAGDDYVNQPENGVLLRATLLSPPTASPEAVPALRPNGTGITEDGLATSLLALEDAIVAAHPGASAAFRLGPANAIYPDTFTCIDQGFCGDDERDRLAMFAPAFDLGPNDLAYALGVNHEATGKASYANFAVVGQLWSVGVAAVEHPDFPGSAAEFLPSDPNADLLYAWRIARDCTGLDRCVEVPYTCPGAPPGTNLNVTFRAYLEPATGTAPLASELQGDRVVVLRDAL